MPLHPSVQKALEGIHRTGEAAKDIGPVLRAASLVASFSRLRGLSHILRAGYLAIRVARLAGKFLPAPASPSPTPRAPTIAPYGSVPPVRRPPPPPTPPQPSPPPKPPSPPTIPSPKPRPPRPSPQRPKPPADSGPRFMDESGGVPTPFLSAKAVQPWTNTLGPPPVRSPAAFPSAKQGESPRAPKPMLMPSAERRTAPPRPAKMKRPPPRQDGPKPWEGWRSQDRGPGGRWNGLEKPGWDEGKGQSGDDDDATEDREAMLETVQELRDLSKEILAALKHSPNEPGRRNSGGTQEGDETAPGNGGMSGLLNSAGKLGIGGEGAAEGAEVGAETAEGMGSMMELLETAGPLLGLL